MLADVFGLLDGSLSGFFPDSLRLAVWAVASGVLSMLLYAVTSPQRKLGELKSQSDDLHRQLSSYEGDFSGAMALTQQNLLISLKRVGWALGPALLAGVPVVVAMFGLAGAYESRQFLPFGPDWCRSWITGFLVVTSVSALATKYVFKIK